MHTAKISRNIDVFYARYLASVSLFEPDNLHQPFHHEWEVEVSAFYATIYHPPLALHRVLRG
jgi:hypothetical protein